MWHLISEDMTSGSCNSLVVDDSRYCFDLSDIDVNTKNNVLWKIFDWHLYPYTTSCFKTTQNFDFTSQQICFFRQKDVPIDLKILSIEMIGLTGNKLLIESAFL